jgi:hypothetical protein
MWTPKPDPLDRLAEILGITILVLGLATLVPMLVLVWREILK